MKGRASTVQDRRTEADEIPIRINGCALTQRVRGCRHRPRAASNLRTLPRGKQRVSVRDIQVGGGRSDTRVQVRLHTEMQTHMVAIRKSVLGTVLVSAAVEAKRGVVGKRSLKISD